MRAIIAYAAAVVVAYLLGSAVSTLMVMAAIATMGIPVQVADIAHAVITDWGGLLGSYLPLIALAFLVALPVAGQLHSRLALQRSGTYLLAGFIALVALHLIMEATLGLVGFAAARSPSGLALQGLAGLFGAWIFTRVSPSR